VNQSPHYEITYVLSAWSLFISISGYCGSLVFFFGLCMHVAAQFDILGARLEKLIDRELDVASSSSDALMPKLNDEQNKVVHEKLKEIVKQQDVLIDLCELMSQSFIWVVLCHFVSSAILICACILLLFYLEVGDQAEFFLGAISLLAEAFTYAYAGTAIITSTGRLQEAAYNFQWYMCDARNRRMIMMIIGRAQKKICMRAPFFEASIETFLKVRMKSFIDELIACFSIRFCKLLGVT